ncbi:MAG: hypothetical protein LBM70_08310 [Victivallales bacterium]|jgi:cobalamin synthase|nr:hypothetical protein [Victivallales bacterium]
MVKLKKNIQGALNAWEMLIDFPLPEAVTHKFKAKSDTISTLIGFPLVGLILGILLAFAAFFCTVVFKPVAGSVIFAILAVAFLDLKDSGRGLGLLCSGFLLRLRRLPLAEALPMLTGDWNKITNPLSAVFVSLFEIAKVALLFTLSLYGAKLWIIAILVGAFTVQGVLATVQERNTDSAILPISRDKMQGIWWVSGVIYAVLLMIFPFGVIVAAATVYLCSNGFAEYFKRNFNGVTPDFITVSGAVIEFILLLIGVLFAVQ